MLEQRLVSWIAAATTYFTVSTTILIMRFVAIHLRGSGYRFQDWLVVLAWICSIGYSATTSAGVAEGSYGVPIAEVIQSDPVGLIVPQTLWVGQWFWATGTASFRTAILLLYMDIFPEKRFKRLVAGSLGLVGAYWVASLLTIALLCRPVGRNWDTTRTDTCGDVRSLELFSAVFNMVLDLWVVFLPLPTIWGLKLSSNKKWAVSTSFLLGLFTAGINLGRLIHTINCDPLLGVTYCLHDAVILNLGEQTMGIVVACAPTLGVIFVRKRQRRGYGAMKSSGVTGPSGNQASADSGLSSRKKGVGQKFLDSLLTTKSEPETTTTRTRTRGQDDDEAEDAIELTSHAATGHSEPLATGQDVGGDVMGSHVSVTHAGGFQRSGEGSTAPTPAGLEIVYTRDYSVRQDDRPGIAR